MKTFVELKEDVCYLNNQGMGILPAGRIAVLAEARDPEARSLSVVTVAQGGSVITLRVPVESATILGECRAKRLAATDKVYIGEFSGGEYRVNVWPVDKTGNLAAHPYALPAPRKHSASGFGWGYDGDGPADLALAILTDTAKALDTDEDARRALIDAYYMDFRRGFVEKQPMFARWSTTQSDLLKRLSVIMQEAHSA